MVGSKDRSGCLVVENMVCKNGINVFMKDLGSLISGGKDNVENKTNKMKTDF